MKKNKDRWAHVLFVLLAMFALSPWASSAMALLAGMALALTLGNPFLENTKKWTSNLLQISIVGLGAGMDLAVVGRAGAHGVLYTIIGIALTMCLGTALGRLLKSQAETSMLVTVGTAICGGSAIAAAAPAIRAKSHEISIALATVFFLNAAALVLFPWIGHRLALNQIQFGLWSALAIHDTSSVVGAALQYGPRALELATTVKLARALWIIPVTFVLALLWNKKSNTQAAGKAKRPWFILGFVMAAALVTLMPALRPAGNTIASMAKHTLVLTLFLIGSSLTRATLKAVGFRPLLQGFLLWLMVASASAGAIIVGWVN